MVSNEPCQECNGKTTIGSGTTLEADCICNAGFMLGEEGDCVLCKVAEAPWSVAEWAVAPRFDIPRGTVLVLLLG